MRGDQEGLTIAMEMVASANGSPIMFPRLIVRIPPVRLRDVLSMVPFIFLREGECNDPYDGIGKRGCATWREWELQRCPSQPAVYRPSEAQEIWRKKMSTGRCFGAADG